MYKKKACDLFHVSFVDVLEVWYGEEKTRNAMCCVTFIGALLLRMYALTCWPDMTYRYMSASGM